MPLTVTLPVPVDQVKYELGRIGAHIKALQTEVEVARKLYRAVQDCCPHTNKKSYTDRSGVPCSYCTLCDREW